MYRKIPNIWKLNSIFLNNEDEIKMEIRNYFALNGNNKSSYQNM